MDSYFENFSFQKKIIINEQKLNNFYLIHCIGTLLKIGQKTKEQLLLLLDLNQN